VTALPDRSGGNQRLPRKRRQSYRETPDVTEAVERLIRAVGKRVATEDAPDLVLLLALERAVEEAWETAVEGIRSTGTTDREIGRVLGVTRQAVEKRWPRSKTRAA
jgi:hypothetical protein